MATVNISRVAKVNTTSDKLEKSILIIDENGNLVRETQLIETESHPTISENVSGVSGDLIISEDISSQITNGKVLNYTSSNNFKANSLSVFYNGLNITKDITQNSDVGFSLPSDYQSIITSGDSLLLVYAKK